MTTPNFPWHPLGQILVEKGLLDAVDLAYALQIQESTGQLLGEILTTRRFVSPSDLAHALAEQHGIRIERVTAKWERSLEVPPPPTRGERPGGAPWRPLGRVLLDKGLLTQSGLQRALLEQMRTGRLLGEIIVRRGWVSAEDLTRALVEQHGIELEPDGELQASLAAETERLPADETFEVREPAGADPIHTSPSFLDATDFAFDVLEKLDPDALEIVQVREGNRETVWSYSRDRAAKETGRRDLIDVYGYPVARWQATRHIVWRQSPDK